MLIIERDTLYLQQVQKANENVDHRIVGSDAFLRYLNNQLYLSVGSEHLTLATGSYPVPGKTIEHVAHNIFRLPLFNLLGKEEMFSLLESMYEQRPNSDLERVMLEIAQSSEEEYSQRAKQAAEDMLVHVAAANQKFVQKPGASIPVNMILYAEDRNTPVATFEKLIEGEVPQSEDEITMYLREFMRMHSDFAMKNIFLKVSPYTDRNGEQGYLHEYHIIDSEYFEPEEK